MPAADNSDCESFVRSGLSAIVTEQDIGEEAKELGGQPRHHEGILAAHPGHGQALPE